MCLVPSMTTAQILASVFIGLNNFFSGLIVRPQFMTGFFQVTYVRPFASDFVALVLGHFSTSNIWSFSVDHSWALCLRRIGACPILW